MEFTKTYSELKQIFSLNREKMRIDGSDAEIRVMQFTSNSSLILPSNGIAEQTYYHQAIATNDGSIAENKLFSYPVFIPNSNQIHSKAIILLHGLNERSWLKYLPWAYYLSLHTNRPVILFPISFHMNRSPGLWANPRAMMPLLGNRQEKNEQNMSSVANAALSQRLSDDPLRFFSSGKQTAEDLVQLLETIKQGKYPFLAENTRVDFFSYSIGAFLSQILFLANPKNLFSNSKLFLFCGGALFSEMFGTSRFIMDSVAFTSLRKYYLNDFLQELKIDTPFSAYIKKSELGKAFLAMLAPECNKTFRETRLQELSGQIQAITLKKDKVIPSTYVHLTFSSVKNRFRGMVQELDFPHSYTHEMPFPILNGSKSEQVDQSFRNVFEPAITFLNG
ncbi:MAG: DUF6051 family protein [Bacteroidales bacterium]